MPFKRSPASSGEHPQRRRRALVYALGPISLELFIITQESILQLKEFVKLICYRTLRNNCLRYTVDAVQELLNIDIKFN